ncbi:MAG: hypothetical protein ABR549_07635, partial [Mycobacteriales bacterium]
MLSLLVTILLLLGVVVVVAAVVLRALAKRAKRKLEESLLSSMGGPDPLRDPTGTSDATRIKPGDIV